ncbi:MAG: hypothetical protein II981_03335 [Bacteroidales bacterium]|nr:hypothetical protein [Bacteroidales bacterium]
MTNGTSTNIQQVINVIKKHDNDYLQAIKNEENKNIEDFAQTIIIEEFNDAQIEAEEIVNYLKKGISEFDAQFKINCDTEKINVKNIFIEASKNMSEEERKTCFVKILSSLQLMGKDNVTEEEYESKIEDNDTLSEEELLSKTEELINNNVLSLDTISDKVKEELGSEAFIQLSNKVNENKNNYRFLAALWLYIEQRKGNIKLSESELGLSATKIGALAAAGVETIIATNELIEGKIDKKKWQVIVKYILGTLVGILLVGSFLAITIAAGAIPMVIMWSLFGFGFVPTFIGLLGTYYIIAYLSDFLYDNIWENIFDKLSDFYDKYIHVVTEKVNSWYASVRAWVSKTTHKNKETANENQEDKVEVTEDHTVVSSEEPIYAPNVNTNEEDYYKDFVNA